MKRLFDRRRSPRVPLSVLVKMSPGAEEGGSRSVQHTGQSVNLSAGGVYLITRVGGVFVSGDILHMSISVPWELRRRVPFSRIMGSCRVVRVDQLSDGQGSMSGLALAFCGNDVTMLGAAITPS